MNRAQDRYIQYFIVQEMMDTINVVKQFDPLSTINIVQVIRMVRKLFLTGEGSSRIFPAKQVRKKALEWGVDLQITIEGSRQAALYDLSDFVVLLASNSGRTKEVIALARKLQDQGNKNLFGLTANRNTPLEKLCTQTYYLTCGWEQAIPATKSVVEQALFYESILWNYVGEQMPQCTALARIIEEALTMRIEPSIVEAVAKAPVLYFAGYNDGVGEELALKTNEITRKRSDFLEGTYVVHGVEEVMNHDDVVILIDPIEEEVEKYYEVLVKGVGLKVIAIANRETPFLTVRVPDAGIFMPYVYLCAGWNLLVEVGTVLGINLDRPERARKIGNEFIIQ
ncbi:MAG: SIS domain-containing protein [Bacteroidetes bacterium]|nr:SIS domain-containing protein [Bacteroidota bacterium]